MADTAQVAGTAHPRSRGENSMVTLRCDAIPGSSPLTRGKRVSSLPVSSLGGLIPAHAGKTGGVNLKMLETEAHPRSRGENVMDSGHALACAGSSPLTRGKLPGVLHLIAIVRLIPAHAGKTCRPRRP